MKWFVLFFLLPTTLFSAERKQPDFHDFIHDRAQMRAASAAWTLRTIDLSQTMYHLNSGIWYKGQRFQAKERWMPTQNQAGIAGILVATGALNTYMQYRLFRSGHRKQAILSQVATAGLSAAAVGYSFRSKYVVRSSQPGFR